jgi:hypothetical protein
MNSILFVCGKKLGMEISDKLMSMLKIEVGDVFTLEIKRIEEKESAVFERVVFKDEYHQSGNGRTYRKINHDPRAGTNTENILNTILKNSNPVMPDIHYMRAITNEPTPKLLIDIYSPADSKYESLKKLLLFDGKTLDRTTRINENWVNRILELPEWVQI